MKQHKTTKPEYTVCISGSAEQKGAAAGCDMAQVLTGSSAPFTPRQS